MGQAANSGSPARKALDRIHLATPHAPVPNSRSPLSVAQSPPNDIDGGSGGESSASANRLGNSRSRKSSGKANRTGVFGDGDWRNHALIKAVPVSIAVMSAVRRLRGASTRRTGQCPQTDAAMGEEER